MTTRPPRETYSMHKSHARIRGIPFNLTFEEWWDIWEPRYAERGRGAQELGMCRSRDEGGYSVGNVRLDTPKGNAADRVVAERVRKASAAFLDKPRGPAPGLEWCWRHDVFTPYTESDEE